MWMAALKDYISLFSAVAFLKGTTSATYALFAVHLQSEILKKTGIYVKILHTW